MSMALLRRSALGIAIFFFLCGFSASGAWAQAAPNAGTLLREYEKSVPVPVPAVPEMTLPAPKPEAAGPQHLRVLVKKFVIEAHQFPEEELQKIVADAIGKKLTLAELQQEARKISAYYMDHGFMARAYLPAQTIKKDGVVKIIVLEGRLSEVTIDPSSASRFDAATAKAFIEGRVPKEQILRPDDLHEGLAVLNEQPGVVASASLRPGLRQGDTDALVKLIDGPLLTSSFQIDNQGIRSVGSTRGIASGFLNNALGLGDQFSAVILKSSGSDYSRLGVTLPAGTSGLRYGVNASMMHYGVDPGFSAANQQGYAYTIGGTLSYPVIRHTDASLTTDLAFNHERLVNSVLNLNSSDKQLNAGVLHVNAVVTDQLLAGAINSFDVSTTFGALDLTGNRGNYTADQASARTNGFYTHLNVGASRLQSFDAVHQLFLSARAQLSPQNLDSAEQMSLGGPDGVRAYPTDEALGDLGLLGRIELRHNVYDGVQLFDFYDAGWIQQHQQTWAGWSSGPYNTYWLQDLGVGVNWKPVAEGNLGLTFAHTLGSNPGQVGGYNSDGYNNHWRILAQASYAF